MGTFCRVPLWILLVILGPLTAQEYNGLGDYTVDETVDYTIDETMQGQEQQHYQKHHQKQPTILLTGPPRISVIPVASHTVVKAVNAAHNNRVCSTWGNFNFKNFDGNIFHFPGTCNYIFASNCKSTYEDFSVQIRRSVVDKLPVIEKITMKIDGLAVVMNKNTVSINDKDVQLPFSGSGIQIEKHGIYLTMTSKLGMVLMWNDDDSLLLELDEKYANQTCGLCGDFNGILNHNEFFSNGVQITESQFGNMQKLDGPTEQCADVPPVPKSNCTDHENICESILLGSAFSSCHSLVSVDEYIEACVKDLCRCDSKNTAVCLCDTFAEYSRQCAHAGGQPANWRTKDLCPKTCPLNMQYQECGSPCADSCSNPERSILCEDHCLEGCFCPPGTVFDDIHNMGCVPLDKCSCTFNSNNYAAGTSFRTTCSSCVCNGGKWKCEDFACPATCSIDGGSHITTYDQSHYSIHGDCNYVLTKDCKGSSFIILTELRKCGLTESETCLKSVTLILNGETIVVIKPCGSVFVNNIYTRLPMSAANVTVFRPSSFYIIVETSLGVQLVAQLIPFMQVYVVLDPAYKGQTCGLCGNFNDKQTDDYQTINGVIEGTAASFANTWKTQADCANVKNVYEDPCSLSIENEKYAQHWCGLISDPSGPFAACHATVNPEVYQANCMFDTCNCEKSEECMCASLSSYVLACATKGIIMEGWRTNVCFKYMNNCPKTQVYTYSTSSCQPTCRSLSEPDVTCGIKFPAVDGCTCAKGFYLDDSGKCIAAEACPCYYKGSAVPSGETLHDNGIMCTCSQGKLSCIGTITPTCTAPMVYLDCKNVTKGTKGAECQKSCHTLDMACYSAKCVSGCVCPAGLVSDSKGACIKEDQCPCIHNDATYQPGEKITMKCNTCTCKDRMWQCTNNPCLATCAVYGDGHYITFDGKRYNFNGDCEYILAQDHCSKGGNGSTFRVVTENIPCGTTGTTCSKSIKVFLESYELILTEQHIEVLERGIGGVPPYQVRHMGIYLVIEADNGLILMWDKRTSIFIKLSKDFEGKVCGLCGDYNGNGNNDFTTRSLSVVGDVFEFGNSWKVSPTCPDAKEPKDACRANPYRKSWAQKQCSILNSKVFDGCHAQVDVSKYYDACVEDACACDSGGDCECFCTAVAAYAQACGESGVCVSWRTPSICPLFCDYYNPQGECEWHYKPCGAPCMKTCRNPSGKCMHELSGLEGCYPSCPAATPFFDEDDMECVAQCGCYDDEGKHYKVGQPVPSSENCKTCTCKMSGIECKYQKEVCQCEYHGKMYHFNDVIYNTTDGIGGCISAICKENGTIYRDTYECKVTTTPGTTFTFTTTHSTTRETKPTPTTICVKEVCEWSQWLDASYPEAGMQNGDFDTYDNILAKGLSICKHPRDIQCRAERFPETPLAQLEQTVQCNVSFGLICQNSQQLPPICYNYEIRVLCCSFERCDTTPTTTPEITTPKATTPKATTPKATTPKATTPKATTPKATTPKATTPKATTPATTKPPSTTQPPTTHPTTTPSTTLETTTPTECHPKCTWTEWLDVHLPGIGKDEGDFETYDKIIAEGHRICKKPDGIQCRSEKFPKVPIGKIGQVVQCNLTFGLVCKNEEQEGDFKVCLNYQIKVLCCDDYSHCGKTTTPVPTTPVPPTTTETTTPVPTTPTPVPPTTTKTTTPVPTTPVPPTTTETTTPTPTTPVPPTTTETTTPTPTTPVPPTTTETTTPVPTTPVPPTTTKTTTPVPTTPVPPTTTETTTLTPTTPVPPTTTETTTPTPTTPVPPTTTETTTPTTPVPPTTTETTTPTPTTPVPPTTTETTTPTTPVPPTTTETTTPTPTTPVPPTTTETTTPTPTTPVPPTTTETTTPTPTTPVPPTTTATTTPETVVTRTFTTPKPTTQKQKTCEPQCTWTTWIDVDIPTSGIDGGDKETFENILANGKHVCRNPQNIECRAADYPGISIESIGQKVQCDVSIGLVCNNKDQVGKVKQCYNYQIKVLCCDDYSHCSTTPPPTTAPTSTLTTETPTTATTTTVPPTTTPTTTETTTTTTTTVPPTTTETTTTTTTETTTTTTTPVPTTTTATTPETTTPATTTPTPHGCQPKCKWTPWIDVDTPTSGIDGGDKETFQNIIAKDKHICKHPKNIECRAEDFPDITIDNVGQVVTCNLIDGLVCNNKDQTGDIKLCLNYQIKVLCCDDYSHCSTVPPQTTTHVTTTTTVPPTTPKPTTTPTTTTTTETTTTTTTTVPPTTPKPTTPTTTTTTAGTITTPTTTPVPPTTTETTTPTTTETTTTTTTTPVPTTTTTTTPETTTPATTTPTPHGCQPKCKWTPWIDVDTPTSGIDGGDKETFQNIIAKDKHICKHPQNIECRAEDFPDITIDNIGQVVTCNLIDGLVCNNKDQTGDIKLCLNYQIKVLCCDDYSHCSTVPPQTTTHATTTTTTVPPTTPKPTTTPTTTTTTETATTTTTTVPPTTPKPTTTPTTTTTTETTTTTTTTPVPTTTTTTTTTPETTTPATTTPTPHGCQPKCKWTTWIDVDTPTSGIDGGDKETFENIIAKDKHICKHPKNIECRAEDFPEITIDNIGQVVTCNLIDGLVCNNKDQTGKVKLCYNYQIKVLCCDDYSHCSTVPPQTTTHATTTTTTVPPTTPKPTTTPTTTTTTETTTTTTTTVPPTTPKPTTTPTTTTETTTTTTTTPVPTTTTTTTPETTTPATTTPTPHGCQPKCKWTTWIDVDTPTSGIDGGDKETFENIIAKDKHICKHPKNIECRAEDFPDITIGNIGQVVTCNLIDGLVCNNKDQTGKVKLCYNYQIKVLCCDDYSHCSTVPPQTTTHATTTTTTVPPTTPKPTTTPTTTTTTETTTTTTTTVPPTTPKPTTPTTTTETTTTTTTTPVPTTTTTPKTTTTPATTTPTPHGCQPKCKWTPWIDVDTPTSGIDGGDKETFQNIIAKDKHICKHPQNIECRAEDFPDISIDNVGQVVTCNLIDGLVCHNKDQTGDIKLCLNYQIKVLCCDDYSHCSTVPPQTTTHATTTPATTTTTTPTTTTTTTTVATTTTTKPTTTTPETTHTTKCFCHVDSKFFSPGQIIYNKTDEAGCIFYAVCNDFCEAERFTGPCRIRTTVPTTTHAKTTTTVPTTTTQEKTTTAPTTTTQEKTTTTVPTTTTPEKTTVQEGCPPHKTKETWMINNCTVATCHGNNVITIEPVSCPKIKPLSCANGFPPVKKMSADGCCEHYECQCVCSGWGDPHYITFDGTYYTFLDNCTYVLVQQITPKYDNFRVLVDNYFCDAEDGLSCPQSILIFYKSNEIVLTRMVYEGRMNNRIRFNKEWVTPGFTKDGIIVTSAGINMIVEIPEIDAYISFSGMIFVIKLPFDKFGHNTEGQCGTCSNNGTEDCRMPDGKIVKDCSKMAYHWKVNDNDKPYCNVPPPTSPPNVPTTPPPTCPPSSLCDIILSDVFAECHKVVPPKPYHEGCTFDACRIRNESVPCSSLEIYATLCAANGVCVNWRNKTKGHCPYSCPAGKVYNACGPMHAKTCESKEVEHLSTGTTEGCYCPEGTTLFNSYTNVCVKSCSCVGPEGMPKAPGETWTSRCKECICEKNSLTVQCKAMTCPPLEDITCKKEGFILEALPDPDQPCCMKNGCYCNSTYCVEKEKKCDTGLKAVTVLLEGDCCPTYDCKPPQACMYNDVQYKPGHKIPQTKGSCKECVCTDQRDTEDSLLVQCTPTVCKVECGPGTKLVTSEDDCCGKCEPVACTVKAKDGSTKIVKPGETYTPDDQPCVKIECHVIEDQYVPTEVRRVCAIEDCPKGSEYKTQQGECCGSCVQVACVVHLSDNSTKLMQPDETYTPDDQPCIRIECHVIEDQYVPTEVRRVCAIEDCPKGSEYKTQQGECCGSCVQVACVVHLSDDKTKLMQPGEHYTPPEDKCSTFSCSSTYDVVKTTETCPAFDRANCLEGTIKSDGCCETCETALKGCGVHKQSQRIKTSTCESDEVVELSYCGGACMTSSKYSAEANSMEHKCSCCQEVKTSKRQVNLKCLDGTSTVYTYIYTEECGCTHTECQTEQQTSSSQQHEEVQTEQEIDQEQQSQQTN